MSTRVSRGAPLRGASSNVQRRKRMLEVDLNAPPCEYFNEGEVGTSSHAPIVLEVQVDHQVPPPHVVPIDVDSLDDDDVILTSPRTFAEAKGNARRNPIRSTAVNADLVAAGRHVTSNCRKRQRNSTNRPVINSESFVDLEGNIHGVNTSGKHLAQKVKSMVPPPPPPPEPAFSCPVCMGPLVEEMSTKCGHIFCKACIKQAITTQGKCPTCRRKVMMKDTIRIYLPATSLT